MLYRIRKKASWNMVKSLTGYGEKYYSIRENALKNTEKLIARSLSFPHFVVYISLINYKQACKKVSFH